MRYLPYVFALGLGLPAPSAAQETADGAAPGGTEVVARVVDAAEKVIASLDEEQRARLRYRFDDDGQRHNWSNLPVGAVPRGGVRWGDLDAGQKRAVMDMLAATLSPEGLQQIKENMHGDEVLKQGDRRGPGGPPRGEGGPGERGPGERGPGGPPRGEGGPGGRGPGGRGAGGMSFGEDQYFVSILGEPSVAEPWMWQFGGHHLAFNATVAADGITLSPTLTGGQPMTYEREGRTVRQLDAERQKAFAFVGSLTPAQLGKAVSRDGQARIQFGPGDDDARPKQEGIRASDLDARQRGLLLDLIAARVGLLNRTHAAAAMAAVEKSLDDTWFVWFGPTDGEGAAAYRVQGPRVVIEFMPQQMGGDPADHVHAMYRDPANDYGSAWTAAGR